VLLVQVVERRVGLGIRTPVPGASLELPDRVARKSATFAEAGTDGAAGAACARHRAQGTRASTTRRMRAILDVFIVSFSLVSAGWRPAVYK
jgi:hypothetical protein